MVDGKVIIYVTVYKRSGRNVEKVVKESGDQNEPRSVSKRSTYNVLNNRVNVWASTIASA